MRRCQPELGESSLVVGLGVLGLLTAQLLKLAGNYVAGWDLILQRSRLAQVCGIDLAAVVTLQSVGFTIQEKAKGMSEPSVRLDEEKEGKMIISCSTINFDKNKYKDVFSALDEAKALGFHAVDLVMFEDWLTINPSEIKKRGIGFADEINTYLKQNNMTIDSINANFFADIGVKDEEMYAKVYADFLDLVWFAELLGVKQITFQPGRESSNESKEITLQRLKTRLFEISDVASKKDIRISIEPHHGSLIESLNEIEAFIQEMYPKVSLTFDSSHQIMQGIKTEEILNLLKVSSHCHLRDANLGNMQANLWEGETDFDLILAELKHLDYQGVISIEYFNGFDKDFANLKQLKTLLEREI